MKIIDLSHTLKTGMPVFPGDTPPKFNKVMTHKNNGAQVIRMEIATHHGTHLDCPLHFFPNGKSTENSDISSFYGNAFLADCRHFGAGQEIPASYLDALQIDWGKTSWIILYTGWYKHWGTEKYFENFPVLSTEAAQFLVDKKIVGIGLDVISIDAIHSTTYPVHQIILGNGLYIVENLNNLHEIGFNYFNFATFPLKVNEGDGSPVRAVGILN